MKTQKLLAIAQDWRLRRLIQANLEAVGFEVQEAVSEEHGLRMVRESRPDLVLLDLELRGVDALHLLHSLRAALSDRPVPIVVMSAEPPSRQILQHQQRISFLRKPFAVPALLAQIRGALEEY